MCSHRVCSFAQQHLARFPDVFEVNDTVSLRLDLGSPQDRSAAVAGTLLRGDDDADDDNDDGCSL